MFRYSRGPSKRDRLNGRWVGSETVTVGLFTAYIDYLESISTIVREPWEKDGSCLLPEGMDEVEPSTPWTAAFLLRAKGQRRKEDVTGMGRFFAGDKDDGNWSLEALHDVLRDIPHCLHTTTKSREHARRWRIILELDREHSMEEFYSVFRYVSGLLDGLDANTKNVNRVQFVPSHWTGADNVFARFDKTGTPLCVDDIVVTYPLIIELASVVDYVDKTAAPLMALPITDEMVASEIGHPPGGRLFRLMCAGAARFKRNGWMLQPDHLAAAGSAASTLISPGKRRRDLQRQAQRAIDWANANVQYAPALHPNFFFTGNYYAREFQKI